jgi:hypothetical protein
VWLGDPSDIVAATNIKPMPGTLAVSGSSLLAAAPALASGSIGTLSTAIHLAANAFSDLSVSAAPSGAW